MPERKDSDSRKLLRRLRETLAAPGGGQDRLDQITHHIAPDVDAERDLVIADLTAAGYVASVSEEPGIGATTTGRNGGGDPYFTDGFIKVAELRVPD